MSTSNAPSTSKKESTQKPNGKPSPPLTAKDFKGFFAPILACFNDDEFTTLNLNGIDKYAAWLKREKIQGVCVNTITGEGPALGVTERRLLVEAWWTQCKKYDLLLIVQVGGAPLPDVLHLAEHSEELGVHAVLCLPELFYKPKSVDELVGFCKIVAKKCASRPFLYYHYPSMTEIDFDMSVFCNLAERSIPNFLGLLYTSADLEVGSRTLRDGRVVLLGSSLLMAGASLLGFESFMCSALNVRPELARSIITAMNSNQLTLARQRQQHMNELIHYNLHKCESGQWVDAIKLWFNSEYQIERGPGFSIGPVRKFSIKKTY